MCHRLPVRACADLGAAALNAVPVLGHGCDNVDPSSHVGNPLGDSRGARGRSWELRDLTRADAAAVAAEQTTLLRVGLQLPQIHLSPQRRRGGR